MEIFEYMRFFWSYAFESSGKVKPVHAALYFYLLELNNRLGWKKEFGLPTTVTMDAIGVSSYNTYKSALNDLHEFGIIKIVKRSVNQYQSCIIALSKNDKAKYKAHDKALLNHGTKQMTKHCSSTIQSTVDIDKQLYSDTTKQQDNDTTQTSLCEHTPEEIAIFQKWISWIKENAPDINKLSEPLTIDQLMKLRESESVEMIQAVMVQMHNYKALTKKYKSTYLTLKNWIKREKENKKPQKLTQDEIIRQGVERLRKGELYSYNDSGTGGV